MAAQPKNHYFFCIRLAFIMTIETFLTFFNFYGFADIFWGYLESKMSNPSKNALVENFWKNLSQTGHSGLWIQSPILLIKIFAFFDPPNPPLINYNWKTNQFFCCIPHCNILPHFCIENHQDSFQNIEK